MQQRPSVHDAAWRLAETEREHPPRASCFIVVVYRDERRVFDSRAVAIELVTERGARWLADLVRAAIDAGVYVSPAARRADASAEKAMAPTLEPHVRIGDAEAGRFLAVLIADLAAAGHAIPPVA